MATPLDTYNISQRFFVQKVLDLFYENALDSYRVRYNNSNTCLREVYKLIKDWKNNKIKRFETVSSAIKELVGLLNKDKILKFGVVKKEDFITHLNSLANHKDGEINNELINELEYTLHYVISSNRDFIINIFGRIETLLPVSDKRLNVCIPNFVSLSQEIEAFATELINIGYSKVFLYRLTSRTFIEYSQGRNFEERWEFFKKVIEEQQLIDYAVVFKFSIHNSDDYINHFEKTVPVELLPPANLRAAVSSFIKEDSEVVFKAYNVKALDFYQAIRIANEQLAYFLDILHFSYNDIMLTLNFDVLVIDQNRKNKANIQKINYLIDGGYLSQDVDYATLNSTIMQIFEKDFISDNVKDKIKSAVRYLRMGNEAIELEQKYICYWIALEHIFSVHSKGVSTFQRMSYNLTNIQIIYYLKRNIQYLHNDIKKHITEFTSDINLKGQIESDDLEYISKTVSIDKLVDYFIDINPLLAYKINRVKSTFKNSDAIKDYIINHQGNIQKHLIRLYRVRNELMHDAAIIQNIENLTGNLKYYLVFTLNLLLQHFSMIELNGRLDKEIDLEDFFKNQTMLLNHIIRKYDKTEILNIQFTENILV